MLGGLAGAGASLVVACGGGGDQTGAAGSGKPKRGGTLAIAQETELTTLDPAFSPAFVEREVYYNIYESLLNITPELKIVPGLATSWTVQDPVTYVFQLRKGVTFHDGTTFDAQAVKWNLERYLTVPGSFRRAELASVASVEVRDASTVVLHLANPDASLLSQLVDRAGMILSPTAVQKAGAGFKRNATGAGTGPFRFAEWVIGDHLTIQRNPDYWQRGLPYLDTVVYHAITDLNASLNQLRSGSVDMVRNVAGKDVATIKSDANLVYRQIPGLGFDAMLLNSKGVFADVNRRKAVATAIDRPELVRAAYFNVGPPSYGPLPPPSWAYNPPQRFYGTADPKSARKLGTGFEFVLKTSKDPVLTQEAQVVQAQLAKAGITAHIQVEDAAQITSEEQAHHFDAALLAWSGRLDPDGNMYGWFHTTGPFNWGQYSNPDVDSLLDQGRRTDDQSKRRTIYRKAQQIVVTEAPLVYFHYWPSQEIHTTSVKGFTLYPDGMNRLLKVWKS
jgi:peptide/nickel transport system substrate-binding protein